MDERFTTRRHRDYIELFDNGKRVCSCDNDKEVEEEKNFILNKKQY
jgi:hypothetical protein